MEVRVKLLALMFLLISVPAFGAEITWLPDEVPSMLISGPIEKGDFEKFRDVLKENEKIPYHVNLNSLGGDLTEAFKIGRLVRELRLSTVAPLLFSHRNPSEVLCWREWSRSEMRPIDQADQCVCASACFFIFVAGVDREGDLIAIHRPYMAKRASEQVALDEYATKYREVEREIRDYLTEMGVSQKWYDILISQSSQSSRFLTSDELREFSYKWPHDIEEWLLARCIKLTPKERQIRIKLWPKMQAGALSEVEKMLFEEISKKHHEESVCEVKELSRERQRAFSRFLNE